jgi:C4-dicarboxylate-specific signal transduction histidine kinase
VQIRDENSNYIANLGRTSKLVDKSITKGVVKNHSGGTFGYSFPLIFEFSGRTSLVGDVTLYSSSAVIFGRIEVGLFFLIGNAIIKTAFLVFLFMSAFRSMLTSPLNELSQQITEFNLDDPQSSKLNLNIEDDNELKLLETSYNKLIDEMIAFQTKLARTQSELQHANSMLDDQNISLEEEVAKKTATLSRIMLDLEQQKDELLINQRELRQENENRQFIEEQLRKRNSELAASMETIQVAKDQLLESERMASLGGLVAGIAHNINVPLSVSVTATSFLQDRLKKLQDAHAEKKLTGNIMASFFSEAEQSVMLLTNNLNSAADLISSFKQITVDQTSEAEREINISAYLSEVVESLTPNFKKTQHTIDIHCPDNLSIKCAPGVLAQILTNMITNSLIHGFEGKSKGAIKLDISEQQNNLIINYRDDGRGLDEETLKWHFDAFFTTRRGKGGNGLGTHIMYNLVTQTLGGKIEAFSEPEQGLRYVITIPV